MDLLNANNKHMTKFVTALKNKLLSEIEENNDKTFKLKS
jgi:hypothetical protein